MNIYKKNHARRSIASDYFIPVNLADIRRKSYSVETFVPIDLQDNYFDFNLGHNYHSTNSQINFKILNDSLKDIINNNNFSNTRLVSNKQMDKFEKEEQYSNEYVPITIEVNNTKSALDVQSTESISNSSFESKLNSELIEDMQTIKTYTVTELNEDKNDIIKLKEEIQTLKTNLTSLQIEISEMKSMQANHEAELNRINNANAKNFRNQQKKILFLIKRLFDLERDENDDYSDVANLNSEQINDDTIRF